MSNNIFIWAHENNAKLVFANENFLIYKYYDKINYKYNFKTVAIKNKKVKPFDIDLYSLPRQ
jgi:hypothetical protein